MLPCGRRAQSHISISFKHCPNNSLKNIRTMLTLIPKWPSNPIKNHQTNDTEKHGKTLPKIQQTIRYWLTCWRHLLDELGHQHVLFVTCFWKPLGGTPLHRCWSPLGHPWSDVVDVLKDFSSKNAPIFKVSRATNCTNHTFKNTIRI